MNRTDPPADIRFTPTTQDGPVYPPVPFPRSSDLTNGGSAVGTPLSLHGYVYDYNRQPVANAVVEIWQADVNGYYKHPRAAGPDALDPYWRITADQLDSKFDYFSSVETTGSGRYSFQTIIPRWYHVFGTDRAAHIHIKVRSVDNGVLTTEIYFPGDEHAERRDSDSIFGSRLDADDLIVDLNSADEKGAGSPGFSCQRDIYFR